MHTYTCCLRTSANRRRGVTLVETAIVLNLFLLMMFAIMEYGRFVMQGQLLINAAREGARYATVNTSTVTTAQVKSYVTSYLAGQLPASLTINVYQADPTTGANVGSWTNASAGTPIAVEITGTYRPMLPITSILPRVAVGMALSGHPPHGSVREELPHTALALGG
jgi:Flp pilus assembly protein TadG